MRNLRIIIPRLLILKLLLGCQVINKISDTDELENNYEGLQKAIDEIIDFVSIVRIESVNYSNRYPMTKEYDLPYTYGEATVIENLKGELSTKEITYRRFGGILPYEEYIKGSNAPEKVARLQKKNNVDGASLRGSKIVSKWDGDIDVEVGKTYMVLMIHDPSFIKRMTTGLKGINMDLG